MTPTGRPTGLDRTTARAILGIRTEPEPGTPSERLVERLSIALATERLRGFQTARHGKDRPR